MNRALVYLSALVGFGGMVYLAGGAQGQPPGAPPGAPPAAAPQARPTIAVFNMAAVMREYGKAKYQVYMLNKKRIDMSGHLVQWRTDYIQTQQDFTKTPDPKIKEGLQVKLLNLARKIEDKDREVNKMLNDEASTIISQLYDDIKTVVDKTAEMNGYHIVFAYPDAVTPEEQKNPLLKELKLKPPAAQPFFVSRQVDVTEVVIQALNTWYKAPPIPADAPSPPPNGLPGGGGPPIPSTPPMGGQPVRPGG